MAVSNESNDAFFQGGTSGERSLRPAICNLQKRQRFCRSEAGEWPRELENVG